MPDITLAISRTWLTLASDPAGEALVCGTKQSTPVDAPKDGDIRHYAGGRIQATVRDQDDRTYSYTLMHLSATELALLQSWRGSNVLLRTMEGERVYCVYFNDPYRRAIGTTPDDDPTGIATFEVDVVFNKITYDESV